MGHYDDLVTIVVDLDDPETWEETIAELKDTADKLEVMLTEKKINDSGR